MFMFIFHENTGRFINYWFSETIAISFQKIKKILIKKNNFTPHIVIPTWNINASCSLFFTLNHIFFAQKFYLVFLLSTLSHHSQSTLTGSSTKTVPSKSIWHHKPSNIPQSSNVKTLYNVSEAQGLNFFLLCNVRGKRAITSNREEPLKGRLVIMEFSSTRIAESALLSFRH